jgi:hypothetical protein
MAYGCFRGDQLHRAVLARLVVAAELEAVLELLLCSAAGLVALEPSRCAAVDLVAERHPKMGRIANSLRIETSVN